VNRLRQNDELKTVPVSPSDPETVSAFLALGRDYLKGLASEEAGRFLQSILKRQGQPNRWLLLLKHKNEWSGFTHVKIDNDERPGWGFILEFYIVPTKRRIGLGTTLFSLVERMLQAQGVKNVWLLPNRRSEQFWHSVGFRLSPEVDEETGRKVMMKPLRTLKKTLP
jgi:GNAT superfamily N-acetyltransferase